MKIYNYKGKNNICGDKIRQARALRGVTQEELAAKMQTEGVAIERNSISKMESGVRFVTDYELLIISKVLEVDIIWLLSDQP